VLGLRVPAKWLVLTQAMHAPTQVGGAETAGE